MSRTSSGISIQRCVDTSCLISSIGNRGARSAGPMGCPVPGCRTGGAGVFRSAAMLYHFVGMSFSPRTIFVCDLSAIADLPRRKSGPTLPGQPGCVNTAAIRYDRRMATVRLPRADRTIQEYRLGPAASFEAPRGPITSRIGFAAVHVVADPLAEINPTLDVAVDWDATLAYRRYVWSLGLAVAEAMDTSQRGMGFPWRAAKELIKRSVAEARTMPGAVVFSGAGTDDLAPAPGATLAQVEAEYEAQCGYIESVGGRIILMASRALAACAKGPEHYAKVYGRILTQAKEPVIIHWLGDMFDPALAGYWGSGDLGRATETLLAIVHEHAAKIDGVKISLLDQAREIAMRRRFPKSVRMYTGDDFDYPTTIGGDAHGYSDALLGIFDVIAPAAAAGLRALDRGDRVED